IELAIFDIAGRKVATVAAGKYAAGSHTVTFNAENLSTGVYFYRLQTKSSTQIARKMLLLK
ncbi:MAG: T9SS type A sorting domain-containing protein, partial [Calditrichaeota bacterium]|nr:T9SS type A sorting domain-containing protein [Calditrichota bacterium]